jgi:outer membrane protein TolC
VYLQVITAQAALLQEQVAAVNILARRMVSSVALVEALGGGWDPSSVPTPNELRQGL